MKQWLLPLFLLMTSCTTVTLRPQIVGQAFNSKTRLPVSHVMVYSYDGTQKLAESGANGRFTIPALTKTRLIIPGDEKDQLGPHAYDFLLRHGSYATDTLKVTAESIQTGTIYLKPL